MCKGHRGFWLLGRPMQVLICKNGYRGIILGGTCFYSRVEPRVRQLVVELGLWSIGTELSVGASTKCLELFFQPSLLEAGMLSLIRFTCSKTRLCTSSLVR